MRSGQAFATTSWPFGEPKGGRRIPDLSALLLPGVGWDLAKLRKDPLVAKWIAHGPYASVRIGLLEEEVDMYDAASSGAEGEDMLNAAMYQSLILHFC